MTVALIQGAEGVDPVAVARFAKVGTPNEAGCMPWLGAVGKDGYGHFRWNGKVVAAHRVAVFLATGEWPCQGLHQCDFPLCCNPAHIRDGSHKQNMEDCAAKGRNRSPRPGNGYQKLSDSDVDEIRRRYRCGETNKSKLGREFGVTPTRIRQVLE